MACPSPAPVFISFRFGEAKTEAFALKAALKSCNISCFVCEVFEGEDIASAIIQALCGCKLVLILGTESYGHNTGAGFSSFEELRFIFNEKKPFFLVKMCERFSEPETRFRIGNETAYFHWSPGTPLPEDLVPRIKQRLANLQCSGVTLEPLRQLPREDSSGKLAPKSPDSLLSFELQGLNTSDTPRNLPRQESSGKLRKTPEGLLYELQGHSDYVRAVCITPDGKAIISASDDKSIRVWDLETAKCVRELRGHTHYVTAVAATPDSSCVLSGSADKTLCLWKISTGECLKKLCGHTNFIKSVAVSPDGQKAISSSDGIALRMWDLALGVCTQELKGHREAVWSVCISPDGRHILSGSVDKTVRVWAMDTGQYLRDLKGHTNYVMGVAVCPNNTHAVSGSIDKTVRLWNFVSATIVCVMTGHASAVKTVAVSPDGLHVVSGSDGKVMRVWGLGSGAGDGTGSEAAVGVCRQELRGHDAVRGSCVLSVTFTADGHRVVSGSADRSVRVWTLA